MSSLSITLADLQSVFAYISHAPRIFAVLGEILLTICILWGGTDYISPLDAKERIYLFILFHSVWILKQILCKSV